jgi:hypothetical protein
MNKYLAVSTEMLEDKVLGGKLNYRETIWLVSNMVIFTMLNPMIDNLLIIVLILVPINIVLYIILKKRYKGYYLELYLHKRYKKINKVVIHSNKNEDKRDINDDGFTTLDESRISI